MRVSCLVFCSLVRAPVRLTEIPAGPSCRFVLSSDVCVDWRHVVRRSNRKEKNPVERKRLIRGFEIEKRIAVIPMRDTCEPPVLQTTKLTWSSALELLDRLNRLPATSRSSAAASSASRATISRPVGWPNGPMAGREPSRVPPPHEAGPPAAHVAAAFAAARPKPLWQPWSDSDGPSQRASRRSSHVLKHLTNRVPFV